MPKGRQSDKSPEELKKNREERAKKIKATADVSLDTVFDKALDRGERQYAQVLSQWYRAVRRGSVNILAKKQAKTHTNEQCVDLALQLTQKLIELLE